MRKRSLNSIGSVKRNRLWFDLKRVATESLLPAASMIVMLLTCSVCRAGDPPITAAVFTPEIVGVVVGSQAGLQLLNWPELSHGRRLLSELENIHDLCFSPDGKTLLIVGGVPGESGTAEMLKWPDGTLVRKSAFHSDVIYEANWSPSGQSFVTASADGFCKVIDVQTGTILTQFRGHSRAVLTAVFLDAEQCISGGVDQTIRVWQSADGTLLRTLNNHTQAVNGLKMQPGITGTSTDLLASISEDRTVRIWQPRIGRLVKFARLPSQPRSIVWSADVRSLHVSTNDGVIHRIEVTTMKSTAQKMTTVGRIHELLLDSERQILLAAGQNGLQSIDVEFAN
jgi:WD40 repeat protein